MVDLFFFAKLGQVSSEHDEIGLAIGIPITPIDDPYQMFRKLYGRLEEREDLRSVLDSLKSDLAKVSSLVSSEDRQLLEEVSGLLRQIKHAWDAIPQSLGGQEAPGVQSLDRAKDAAP